MFDEIHPVPDTPTRKDCWVGIRHNMGDGPSLHSWIRYFSTSKATGWDFPAEGRVEFYEMASGTKK